MGPILSDGARRAATHFLHEYHGQLRPFEAEYEVAPGVVVQRTGGHTPGHSVVRLAFRGDRLTFAGDARLLANRLHRGDREGGRRGRRSPERRRLWSVVDGS